MSELAINWDALLRLFVYDQGSPLLFHTGAFLLLFMLFYSVYGIGYTNLTFRKWWVLLFSLYFYLMASGVFVLLLLLTIGIDYITGLQIHKHQGKSTSKIWLWISILINVGMLGYFKYTNFGIELINHLIDNRLEPLDILLPIGISFFTFQSISYKVDVYKGKLAACESLLDYAFYMSFFPHIVAGPIVRAKDFLYQINGPLDTRKIFVNTGLYLILKGYIKKAIFADYLSQYADLVYSGSGSIGSFSGFEHLMAMYAYTLQIFCDFSGYTDMAIGIAAVMGFKLCENFDSPYQSLSITEFWRRWHISLSSWLRDYIYIPLGGNRKGPVLQMVNQLATMLIGGLWHGASLRFVAWGAGHGLALVGHKLWLKTGTDQYLKDRPSPLPKKVASIIYDGFSWLITFHVVALLWILFRVQTTDDILLCFEKIFTQMDWNFAIPFYEARPLVSWMLPLALVATLIPKSAKSKVLQGFLDSPPILKLILFIVAIGVAMQLAGEGVQPFIYFQF
jgi:alginate O-acetyltransferase complex protein AlgI